MASGWLYCGNLLHTCRNGCVQEAPLVSWPPLRLVTRRWVNGRGRWVRSGDNGVRYRYWSAVLRPCGGENERLGQRRVHSADYVRTEVTGFTLMMAPQERSCRLNDQRVCILLIICSFSGSNLLVINCWSKNKMFTVRIKERSLRRGGQTHLTLILNYTFSYIFDFFFLFLVFIYTLSGEGRIQILHSSKIINTTLEKLLCYKCDIFIYL